MNTVTAPRRIDPATLSFPATVRWDGTTCMVEADQPQPALQAAVNAAPDADAKDAGDRAERERVRLPTALRTKVRANAADPANATAYTAVEATRLLTALAVEHLFREPA